MEKEKATWVHTSQILHSHLRDLCGPTLQRFTGMSHLEKRYMKVSKHLCDQGSGYGDLRSFLWATDPGCRFLEEVSNMKPRRPPADGSRFSPVLLGLEPRPGSRPPGPGHPWTVCNYKVLLYFERVTHPCSPFSSFYILVSVAGEGLEFKKRRCSRRRKATFVTGNSALNGNSHNEQVMLWEESSRDEFHRQYESRQPSAGKRCWQKEDFAKQENKTSKLLSRCRAVIPPRSGKEVTTSQPKKKVP